MTRLALVIGLALLASCGPLPPARPASSGVTAVDGGGEAALHNAPRGSTNFPYRQ